MATGWRISSVSIAMVIACTNDGPDHSGGTMGERPAISTGTFTTAAESGSSTTFADGGLDGGLDDAADEETGPLSPGVLTCDEGCGLGYDCGLVDDAAFDACFDACLGAYELGDSACQGALEALNLCLVELECTDYAAYLQAMPDAPCLSEQAASTSACG